MAILMFQMRLVFFMARPRISILLAGWGGFGGTGVISSLRNNDEKRPVRIICTDIAEKPILREQSDAFYILPRGNSRSYIPQLVELCKKEKVDVILPGSGPEILSISKNLPLLRSQNIGAALDEYSKIRPLMDKERAYSILSRHDLPVPRHIHVKSGDRLIPAIKKLGFPRNTVCFKPSPYSKSGGGRGFKVLRASSSIHDVVFGGPACNQIDYDSVVRLSRTSRPLNLIVMEYLPGTEFSVYTYSENGDMIYCVPNIRQRLEQNYSFEAITTANPRIEGICKKIVRLFDLSYNTNIQIRLSKNGDPKIIEINPRMGGSIVLPKAAGIDMPFFSVKHALGEKIPAGRKYSQTRMIRYWNERFVSKSRSFTLD